MLGSPYDEQLSVLMQSARWGVRLPPHMNRFFDAVGSTSCVADDSRRTVRLLLRTRCLLVPEAHLPAFPRSREPIGIYISDISRYGVGCVAPMQLYPEEVVRILLPTIWLRAAVVYSQRLGTSCFRLGTRLIGKYEPSHEAFEAFEAFGAEPVAADG